MSGLPAGTVTFLFTDIEGSTRLLQELGDRYASLLADHHRLLRTAFHERGGVEAETHGDGLYYTFAGARAALQAALAAQRGVTAHAWPDGASVRVRIGLHTGEAVSGETGLVGLDIHRAARICTAGHGGQILLSQTTRDLIEGDLHDEISLRDLGEHSLKDLARPEHIFQVVAEDLPSEFPPLKSLSVLPNNLPIQVTSFVGREREMAEVKRLLTTSRLLTITGIGGAGKTRLALQVAADILEDFPDGVWLVELAALSDPALVPRTVALALDVREEPRRAILSTLTDALRPKHLLLILDNCEHLLTACASLADTLLHACPQVRILATSREALGIAGETSYRVPSLSLPEIAALPVERLADYEAIRLFIDRATAALPSFTLTGESAQAMATICQRLDGIPLAIELAAPRVKALTIDQIAERLHDRFRLLTGGSRTALPRLQTLRAAMDWSYDLLSDKERVLLRCLSVFAGGFTLEAAEAVCAGHDVEKAEVLDLLTHLVEKSLVIFQEREGRYRLLETVRQYGHERLLDAGEAHTVRSRHRDFFLDLVEMAESHLWLDERWLDRLDPELDNLRAAMQWSLESSEAEGALRLAGGLRVFWLLRGHFSEGRRWLDRALVETRSASPVVRARALGAAGVLAWNMFEDLQRTAELLQESVALFRAVGDKRGAGRDLWHLAGVVHHQGDTERAIVLSEECLALSKEVGDKMVTAYGLLTLGTAVQREDLARAQALYEESLALHRELGHKAGLGQVLYALGGVAEIRGELHRAYALYEEAETHVRELENPSWIAHHRVAIGSLALTQGDVQQAKRLLEASAAVLRQRGEGRLAVALNELGWLALHLGEVQRATALFEESLTLSRVMGHKPWAAMSLSGLGVTAALHGHDQWAERLLEESLALSREIRSTLGVARSLNWLGRIQLRRGEPRRAAALLNESLRLRKEYGATLNIPQSLESLAEVASSVGQPIRAARLFGAAAALREEMGAPLPPFLRVDYERSLAVARASLGEQAFAAEQTAGRAMTLEQAVEYALSDGS